MIAAYVSVGMMTGAAAFCLALVQDYTLGAALLTSYGMALFGFAGAVVARACTFRYAPHWTARKPGQDVTRPS